MRCSAFDGLSGLVRRGVHLQGLASVAHDSHKPTLPTLVADHSIHAAHRRASAWPRMCRSALATIVILSGVVPVLARDEAAVGQCGLTFINAGNSCEWSYGGAGPDPPDGDKLNACWDKATSDYNACMDKAEAAKVTTAPPRGKVPIRTLPGAGILEDSTGLQTQGPAAPGHGAPARGGGGRLY